MALIAAVLLAASVAALRRRLLPRWLIRTGVVLGVSATLGTLGARTGCSALYPLWFVGLFGWWFWTLPLAGTFAVHLRRAARRGTAGVGREP